MVSKNMKKFAIFMPLLAGICWGLTGLFVRNLGDHGLSNVSILGGRTVFAVLILLIGILIYNKERLKIRHLKDLVFIILAGFVGSFALNVCYNYTISVMTMSLAAILLCLAPIFTLILAAIFFREKITTKKVLCMVFAIFGCVLASGIVGDNSSVNVTLLGVFIGLLSAFFYGVYSICSKVVTNDGYTSLTITFYSQVVILIACIPFTNWNSVLHYMASDPFPHSAILIIHALLSSAVPYLLLVSSFHHMDTGLATIIASGAEPVTAAVLGMFFYQEIPTVIIGIGLVITIVALCILLKPDAPPKEEPSQVPS
ncbi:DMT family transporter [Eubacterium oxidoreducens]|nr:DMT family transporter [Eubacterium oxidoreducens]